MKAVFCDNCKWRITSYYKMTENGGHYLSAHMHEACEAKNTVQSAECRERLQKYWNKNYDCSDYQRSWWRIWA